MNNKIKEEKIKLINKNLKLGIIVLGMLSIVMLVSSKSYALFTRTVETENNVINITSSDKLPTEADKLLNKVKDKTCSNGKSPIIEDTDGTIYFSGDNECIDFNYLWYSGRLWRITSINSDGTMKMITQDIMTAIAYDDDDENFEGSWVQTWLNEDFLSTLNNYENIIELKAKWNATKDTVNPPRKPDTITDKTQTIVEGTVGLLSSYEYYKAYQNVTNSTNYLNLGYFWWHLTPYGEASISYTSYPGNRGGSGATTSNTGIRPVVVLKADIDLEGKGTLDTPYTITNDKPKGKTSELINTRSIGEFVKINNILYRIVDIENGKTKLTMVDYLKDENGVMKKNFSKTVIYGSGDNETYWDYYLNNIWVKTIPDYENLLDRGIYYLGESQLSTQNYKASICDTSIEGNLNKTTKECIKSKATYEGYVGLLRIGEMFAGQLDKGGYNNASQMWLISHAGNYVGEIIVENGYGFLVPTNTFAVRPTIHLKPTVIIASGEGTEDKPYEVKVGS